jgi:hypothetical protein
MANYGKIKNAIKEICKKNHIKKKEAQLNGVMM